MFFYIALILLLMILIYLFLSSYNVFVNKKKYGDKEDLKFKYMNEGTRAKINKRLERLDYPFGMNADKYVLYKFTLTVLGLWYVYMNKVQGIQAVIFIIGMFFLIDIYLYLKERDIRSIVKKELPTIVDIFEIGSTTNMDYGDVLLICANSVKSDWLKKRLNKISAEYFVSKDKDKMIKSLKNLADIYEIDVFVSALEQKDVTGRSKEMLQALSQLMFSSVIAHAQKENKASDYKVMIAVFLITIGIFAIYMTSYMPELMSGLKTIF